MQLLDLSYNNIPDRLGSLLVTLIKDQVEQRDTIKWKASLRKRSGIRGKHDAKAEQSKLLERPPPGLTEFIFRYNALGHKFIE